MPWADNYIKKLINGESIKFRPRGHSMTGKINDGQLVEVIPCLLTDLLVGDIVLCTVKGKQYLHLVKAIKNKENKLSFQIGNNKGKINGWTSKIHGKVIKVSL